MLRVLRVELSDPSDVFGLNSSYSRMLWLILAGALLPILFWVLQRFYRHNKYLKQPKYAKYPEQPEHLKQPRYPKYAK
ncbi:unnamed protein product [Didymodactylos carnosus]|uniref:Uncharacterized protein n=1 Tax=Didymodactylos carnosus TaxID=1234261 RepID=A0A8S2SN84_9BILA|nr:unnamed protein product [Didymodactylos carnosus]